MVFQCFSLSSPSPKILQKCSQNCPRTSQVELKMPILALSWPILALSWPILAHLGRDLPPTWSQLRPNIATNLYWRETESASELKLIALACVGLAGLWLWLLALALALGSGFGFGFGLVFGFGLARLALLLACSRACFIVNCCFFFV